MKVKLTLVAELTYDVIQQNELLTPEELAQYEADSTPYRDIVEDDRAIVTVKGEIAR